MQALSWITVASGAFAVLASVITLYIQQGRSLRARIAELKEDAAQQLARHTELQARYELVIRKYAELRARNERNTVHYQQQLQQLESTKLALKHEFENLANRIFEEKGQTFRQHSQTSLDQMLKPLREQLDGFQKRVNEVHDASLQGNTQITAEIRKVLDIGLQMSEEASSLSSALKGDSQRRGAWGEAQLQRTLELSGLVEDAHFTVQTPFRDAEGKLKQTDYLIKLPDGKHLVIDSKVTLNAYDRLVRADSQETADQALAEHIAAVRRHIDELAAKDYTQLIGVHSPSFVLMFMPIEPAYIEALKHEGELFDYGYRKGVVLVSHTTLIPILRTVANLWMIERSSAEAREISDRAGEVFNQVCTVAERLGKLGASLAAVSNHYNSTVTALTGQQGLYGKVDRFAQISARVNKTLPALEPTAIDFDVERLPIDPAIQSGATDV